VAPLQAGRCGGENYDVSALVSLEVLARRLWAPLALCSFVVVTWALVDAFGDVVYTRTAVRMLLLLLVVLGLQIFSGNSGVLSFGHVTFVAIGAYTSALLTIPTAIKEFTYLTMPSWLTSWVFPAELSPLEGTLVGGGFAALFALIISPAIVRLDGVQAGIATLALLVIANVFIVQTSSITRGTSTQIGVPTTTTLLSVTVWVLVAIALAFLFQQSRFGLRLRASRENERAARSVGVQVPRERGIAWVLSAFVCGVAGALYAHYFVTFSYLDFYFNTNGFDQVLLPIAMLVVGGMTSVTGAVIGCYLVTVVFEIFRRWEVNQFLGTNPPSGTTNLVLAVVLLVTLFLRPRGITGGKELPWPTEWRLPRKPQPRFEILEAYGIRRGRAQPAANEPPASAETAPMD
jgi:branched-chain amino acid transport system permease protein